MSSVFHPDGGYPRLIRFVPSSEMPSDDTLTVFDERWNLVTINKDLYDTLDYVGQYQAIRAMGSLVLA